MEEVNDAIGENNVINNNQQQVNNAIVSTITTVTGNGTNITTQITSQTVEDFEPDPKWEITTLERASYDCSDMYIDTLPEQQVKQTGVEAVTSDDAHEQDPRKQILQPLAEPLNQNIDTHANQEESDQSASVKPAVESQQTLGLDANVEHQPTINIESEANEEHLIGEEKDQLTETIKTPAEIVNQLETDSKLTGHSMIKHDPSESNENTNLTTHVNDEGDHVSDTQEDVHQEDANFNSCILSQSSVDPHMEKVIDNIVELGGCQQFAQTLEQNDDVTDKEKEVESIQKEITSNSNMITNILQPNIQDEQPAEANSITENERLTSHDERKQQPDLNTEQDTESHDVASATIGSMGIVQKSLEQVKPTEEICPVSQPDAQIDPLDDKEDSDDSLGDIKAEISSFVDQDMSCYSKVGVENETEQVVEKLRDELKKEVQEKMVVEESEQEEAKQEPDPNTLGAEESEVSPTEEKFETRRTSRRTKVAPKVDQEIDKPTPRKKAKRESKETQVVEDRSDNFGDVPEDLIEKPEETVEKPQEEYVSTKQDENENAEETELEKPIRTMRSRVSKRLVMPESPKVKVERKSTKRSHGLEDDIEKSTEPIKTVPVTLKLASSRMTISTSTPSTIVEQKSKKVNSSFDDESRHKKYRCEQCNYETDRLNNIVYHKKTTDACDYLKRRFEAQVDSWKQKLQSPKSNNKRSSR